MVLKEPLLHISRTIDNGLSNSASNSFRCLSTILPQSIAAKSARTWRSWERRLARMT